MDAADISTKLFEKVAAHNTEIQAGLSISRRAILDVHATIVDSATGNPTRRAQNKTLMACLLDTLVGRIELAVHCQLALGEKGDPLFRAKWVEERIANLEALNKQTSAVRADIEAFEATCNPLAAALCRVIEQRREGVKEEKKA